MKHCADCRAPNPVDRTVCYACGQSLAKRAYPSVRSGERTYPCANCDAPVAYSASVCAACGRMVTPPQIPVHAAFSPAAASPALAAFPIGWDIEALPDGTTRLRRTAWGRLTGVDVSWGCALMGFGVWLLFQFVQFAPFWPLFALPLALLVVGFGWLVWGTIAREELTVGPHLLRGRKALWGIKREWRVTGTAVLRVSTVREGSDWGRNGKQTTRRLRAESVGQKHTLLSHTRQETGLLSGLTLSFTDEVGMLGEYLSAQTGWPLVDPQKGQF